MSKAHYRRLLKIQREPSQISNKLAIWVNATYPLEPPGTPNAAQRQDALKTRLATLGLTNAMSLAGSIATETACHAPSKVIGQVEVGMQCSVPLADKSVGCSLKAWSVSRSMQTMESVDQLSSTSVSRPSISPLKASGDNSQQGCLHRCRLCDYEADKLFHLEEHARVHTGEGLFKCHLCLQSFSKRSTLNRHLFYHTGQRPFICHLCSQCFSSKDTLKGHLSVHAGERPFQCPSCLQRFSQKSKLKEHLRTHTGEKPFQCPSCPLSFSRKSTMKLHLHTHTGEKPYQCPSCTQRFSQRSAMKQHLRVHTGDRPHRCTVCSKSFARADGLSRHKRALHHDTVE
ncbi:zinc finger protein 239-like isoform X2 [Dermacentor albipictus]|uniref:zinc finger protein 239-like isoform X2 n=1 Tax=Dermacentor albipictus TaxID=60249 RepID=UPI0038FD3AEE